MYLAQLSGPVLSIYVDSISYSFVYFDNVVD